MARAVSHTFTLIMALTLLVGCAQIEEKKKSVDMQDRTTLYRKAIRWSEYEAASTFIRLRDGSVYTYDEDFYDRIRVVEMEIQSRDIYDEEGVVLVTSSIEFYHEDYNSVKELTDRQLWWFDIETEQWFMDGTFPDYATALSE